MNIPLVDLKKQYKSIKTEIDNSIQNILDNTSFIMGKPVKEFEESLSKYCNSKFSIGVSSGSSALFLTLKSYGIKEGDEVITVPNSFIATAEAIVQCGAKPVFVDICEDTMLIDVNKIESKITKKTKAIIPVHLYGQICNIDKIIEISKNHNLHIIEDAAQAIGAEYKNKKIPVYETAILSFFPAKNLGCYGDGGAVVTNNEAIARLISRLKDHGRISKYESDIIGYGERLDALQAAILNVKLKYIDEWNNKRITNAKIYDKLLKNITQIKVPTKKDYSKHVYYMYEIQLKGRDKLQCHLKEQGIFTGIHYPLPLHLQKSLKFLNYKKGDFPISEKISNEILSLPMYPELEEKEIEFVCKTINNYLKNV
jgi:dTDP-4-amino-4,6-dideoxygalactose transaminase